jgi:hypothetical protein
MSPSIRILVFRGFSRGLYIPRLFVVLLVFFAGIASSPFVHASNLIPEKLIAAPPVPRGISVDSKTDHVDTTVEWDRAEDNLSFCLILPPDAHLDPEFVDYRLERRTAAKVASQESETTAPLDLSPDNSSIVPDFLNRMKKASLVTAEDAGLLRFYRIVRVKLFRRTIPISDGLQYFPTSLTFRFSFADPGKVPGRIRPSDPSTHGFANVLRRLVANPESASLYGDRGQGMPNTPPETTVWNPRKSVAPGEKAYRILVDSEGWVRIGEEFLKSIGLASDRADPSLVRIYDRGKEIPTVPTNPSSRRFGPQSAILFYGKPSESKFTDKNAYWVTVPPLGSKGKVLHLPQSTPSPEFPNTSDVQIATEQKRTVEQDNEIRILHGNFLSIRGSAWVWQALDAEKDNIFTFDTPDPDPQSQNTIPLTIHFYIDPEASIEGMPPIALTVNDSFSATLSPLANEQDTTRSVTLPVGILKPMQNKIVLRYEKPFPQNGDPAVYLDNFALSYRRNTIARGGEVQIVTEGKTPWYRVAGFLGEAPLLFDMTDTATITQLPITVDNPKTGTYRFYEPRAGRRLLAIRPSVALAPILPAVPIVDTGILNNSNAADYLIVTNRLFVKAAERLAKLQETRGLRTRIVDIDEIFQEYSGGESTPFAIKNFLYHTLRDWKTPPTYVCLLGDASSDYRDMLRSGVRNLIPAYSYEASDGEVWASENWYASQIGNDIVPDLMLGRLPASNEKDAEEMVRKAEACASGQSFGPWRERIAMVADDSDFRDAMEGLRNDYTHRAMVPERVYIDEFPWEDNFYLPKAYNKMVEEKNMKVCTSATQHLTQLIDQGVSLLLFVGHGSPNIWTDERIWFGGDSPNSDNLNLRNDGRLPFVATFTCNHGAFDYPMPPWNICISEDMLRVPHAGAAALFVPSGPGVTSTHIKLAQCLMQSLLHDRVNKTGESAVLSVTRYLLNGSPTEMVRMYVLLGDPAMELSLPKRLGGAHAYPNVFAPGTTQTVTIGMSTPGIATGKFRAELRDASGKMRSYSAPLPFSDGSIECALNIPENAASGEWWGHVYYSDDKGLDGAGAVPISITPPVLRTHPLAFSTRPDTEGTSTTIRLIVENTTGAPARDVPIRVYWKNDTGTSSTLVETQEDFRPFETKIIVGSWTAIEGLYEFVGEVEADTHPLQDDEPDNNRVSDSLFVASKSKPIVCVLPSLSRTRWTSESPNASISLIVPIYYSSIDDVWPCTAYLYGQDTRKPIASVGLTIGGKSIPSNHTQVSLDVNFPTRYPPSALRFVLEKNESDRSTPLLTRTIPITTSDLPDIAIRPDSIHFEPKIPIEGDTVFANFIIENRGDKISSSFPVRVYSKLDNRPLVVLASLPRLDVFEQRPLAPGRSRSVRLRWDFPAQKKVAGAHKIVIRIDPENRMMESNEDNNATTTSLAVLSRTELKTTIEGNTDVGTDGKVHTRITATVKNVGEAKAENRILGFFNCPPVTREDFTNPDNLVKEIALPTIPGGSSCKYTHEWVIRSVTDETSPTALVYRPTKSIRSGSADSIKIEKEW